MMNKIPFISLIVALVCIAAYASPPLFLEREVASALDSRDEYYAKKEVSSFLFPFQITDFAGAESLKVKLGAGVADSVNPWHDLLAGIAVVKSSPDSVPIYFGRALDAAGNDMGTLYALSTEFGRLQQPLWEQKGLERVRKLFLASGAQSSDLISQSLLHKALSADKNGDYSSASLYNSWSIVFDRDMVWPAVRAVFKAVPFHLSTAYNECCGIVTTFVRSWPLQLSFLLVLFLWIRQCILFIVTGLFITLGIVYVPLSLHWVGHLFPSSSSPRLKTYFIIVSFLSLISFGALPFFWMLACLIWRQCGKKDKWITGICCIALVLFPLSVRFEGMLRSSLSPEGALSLFNKAVDEGYYADLDKVIRKHAASHENDYCAQTAAALYAAKNNDMGYALPALQKARSLRGNDPVVLLTEGNVYFIAGALEKSKNAFETCIKQFPGYAPAYFNCGQYYLGTVETIKGMDCIDRATKLDPRAINSFIKTNDESFSKKWPRLRQLMPPEYSAGYFWKKVFPQYWGSWGTANVLWGSTFLGVPIVAYMILSPLVVLLLILIDAFAWSGNRVQKIFLCKLCGCAMCRHCKRGVVCENCYQSLQQIRNENIRQRIIEKILVRNKHIKNCISYCIDVVFPGCGMVNRGFSGYFYIALTSIVYATMFSAYSPAFTYPSWFEREFVVPLYCIMPLYNVVFAFRAILKSFKEFRT
jgi:tetratricopeptide (TPR) repeat protein